VKRWRALLSLLLVLACAAAVRARTPVRVVVAGDAPFVETRGSVVDGVSLRIWQGVAQDAKVPYTLSRASSVDDALKQVETGAADVAVGRVTVTSRRARNIAFTVPYYTTTLCVATIPGDVSPLSYWRPVVRGLLGFMAGLVVLLFLIGNIIWWLERHHNSEVFPRGYRQGLGQGMWLAVVTMTSVGYGDAVPVTVGGRIVASVWMLVAMLFASTVTASITSFFTEYRLTKHTIDTPQKLLGRSVAVPFSSTAQGYATRFGASVTAVPDVSAALALLQGHKVDAVLYYTTELRYHTRLHSDFPLSLVSLQDARADLAFAVRKGSDLDDEIDESVLRLRESGELEKIEDEYLHGLEGTASGMSQDVYPQSSR